jgi:hypothetical protein
MNDPSEQQHQQSSGASTGSTTASVPDMLDNIDNYSITTEINESGKKIFCFFSFLYSCI